VVWISFFLYRQFKAANSKTTQLSAEQNKEFARVKLVNSPMENQFGIPLIYHEGGDSYKIDHSGVAAKSRYVAEIVDIACNINTL
jgi:hypothetical protein